MRVDTLLMRETGLRPSTLHRLKTSDDYQPGAPYLTIREDADKARYGRELPLSDRARAALDSACPDRGTIFPKFDGRHTLRKAALAAGLDPERASKPNQESSGVAQLPEIKGCGREDSNLHECYLTRSLADVADQKANEFKGASRSGTPENTLGRPDFSPVVKNRARDLLRDVVDGGDVSVARIRDFARAVIRAPAFQVAQEILQDASPEFAIRRALELASMVLSADDGATESVSQQRSAMKKDRSGTLAR